MSNAREQRIREIAHQLWLDEGQPEGKAHEHWERAAAMADREAAVSSGKSAGDMATPAKKSTKAADKAEGKSREPKVGKTTAAPRTGAAAAKADRAAAKGKTESKPAKATVSPAAKVAKPAKSTKK